MTFEQGGSAPPNPLGVAGIALIEYATQQPLALCALLEHVGFAAVGRHRSREVTLLRQGAMNVIGDAAAAMELNIPGIHGVGDSIVYFVDRARNFSVYDGDFMPIPQVPQAPPALADLHFFCVVQAIDAGRTPAWRDFYAQLMDFQPLPEGRYVGVVRTGTLLARACGTFFLQLVESPAGAGALTQLYKGGVSFELVASHVAQEPP